MQVQILLSLINTGLQPGAWQDYLEENRLNGFRFKFDLSDTALKRGVNEIAQANCITT